MIKEFYTSKLLSNHKSRILESVAPFNINEGGEIVGKIDSDLALEAVLISVTETLQEYIDANTETVQLNEGVGQVVRKAKDVVAKTVVKFTLADKEMSERINDKFNRYIKIFRDSKRDAAYEGVVKNAINLSRILKNLIGFSITLLLFPGGISTKIVVAVLSLIIQTALDKRSDSKYKNLIFNDLKFEITVVKEKIRDAESRGDIKAKYKLMRIENQLGRAMNRIQYNLKD